MFKIQVNNAKCDTKLKKFYSEKIELIFKNEWTIIDSLRNINFNYFKIENQQPIANVYCIEGNIGIGKSSLLKQFKKFIIVDEPIDLWNLTEISIYINKKYYFFNTLLNMFYYFLYNNEYSILYLFQILGIYSKVIIIMYNLKNNKNNKNFIQERSLILSTLIFSKSCLNDIYYEKIKKIINTVRFYFKDYCCFYYVIINYDKEEEEENFCIQNIKKRNRCCEVNITIEYLNMLKMNQKYITEKYKTIEKIIYLKINKDYEYFF